MGLPLSTFQQLSGLCRNEYEARYTFSRYKAVAVLVHDPDDREFRRRMKYSFERLHETTGPDFAFITFIDPPVNWKRAHQDWMEVRERLAAGEGCDDPTFVRALRDRLALPDSPCIVLTDDLLSDRYLVLDTTKDRFVGQLEAVGGFAEAQERRFPVDAPGVTSFLETLGTVWAERTSDGRSLAGNIADLVAVPALTGRGAISDRMARDHQRRDAEEHVRRALSGLRHGLELIRAGGAGSGADSEEKALGRLSDYMALIAGVARTDQAVSRNETLSQLKKMRPGMNEFAIRGATPRGMERFSMNCLMNYHRLLPLYFAPDLIREESPVDLDYLTDCPFETDYSPLGNYLGKAVEEEVNASLVQWIRKMMGVVMPDHYRLYQEGLDENTCPFIRKNSRLVKFNQKGRPLGTEGFGDRTVALGDTVYATRYMRYRCGDEGPEPGILEMDECLDDLYMFSQRRNEACHNSRFDEEAFRDIHWRFLRILELYVPEMVSLKRILRAWEG